MGFEYIYIYIYIYIDKLGCDWDFLEASGIWICEITLGVYNFWSLIMLLLWPNIGIEKNYEIEQNTRIEMFIINNFFINLE